jgi:hypothetical protein
MLEAVLMSVFRAQGVIVIPTHAATCMKAARAIADGGTVFLETLDDEFKVLAVVCEPIPKAADKALTN